MERQKTVVGTYCAGFEYASKHWGEICNEHEEEFPRIRQCYPGTLNVCLQTPYQPPGEEDYRRRAKERGKPTGRYADGNYVSPLAKVVEINGRRVDAWIYRGGHKDESLELLSACQLVQRCSLQLHQPLTISIVEYPDEGHPDMPGPPPPSPK